VKARLTAGQESSIEPALDRDHFSQDRCGDLFRRLRAKGQPDRAPHTSHRRGLWAVPFGVQCGKEPMEA
jgi:hypothetical protein